MVRVEGKPTDGAKQGRSDGKAEKGSAPLDRLCGVVTIAQPPMMRSIQRGERADNATRGLTKTRRLGAIRKVGNPLGDVDRHLGNPWQP